MRLEFVIRMLEHDISVTSWAVFDSSGEKLSLKDLPGDLYVKSVTDGCWPMYGVQVAIVIY